MFRPLWAQLIQDQTVQIMRDVANGELLCVTAYRKGAYAVRELLERMLTEIVVLREQVKANAEMNGELQVVREDVGGS